MLGGFLDCMVGEQSRAQVQVGLGVVGIKLQGATITIHRTLSILFCGEQHGP